MAKCRCIHCEQHIEFDDSMVGSEVGCPSCGKETKLYVAIRDTIAFCSACGVKIRIQEKFCYSCGRSTPPDETITDTDASLNKNMFETKDGTSILKTTDKLPSIDPTAEKNRLKGFLNREKITNNNWISDLRFTDKLVIVIILCLIGFGIIANFIDFRSTNLSGTDLENLISKNDISLIKKYISDGKDINTLDGDGYTMLHNSVRLNKLEIVEMLIENKANLDIKTADKGMTALALVCELGNIILIERIIKAGANVNLVNKEFNQPIWILLNNRGDDYQDAIILLLKNNAQVKNSNQGDVFLEKLVEFEDVKFVRRVLDLGLLNVNEIGVSGDAPIHVACIMGKKDMVEILLEYKADPNIISEDFLDHTPLLSLLTNHPNDCIDIVNMLIAAGAKPTAKENNLINKISNINGEVIINSN